MTHFFLSYAGSSFHYGSNKSEDEKTNDDHTIAEGEEGEEEEEKEDEDDDSLGESRRKGNKQAKETTTTTTTTNTSGNNEKKTIGENSLERQDYEAWKALDAMAKSTEVKDHHKQVRGPDARWERVAAGLNDFQ